MALLDHRGRPVNAAGLKGPASATPTKSGPRAWAFASVAKGISPEKLAATFDKADKGDLRDLLTLAAELELKDAHAGAQLRTRKLALAALPWKVEAATDDERDKAIAEELQGLVDGHLWQPLVIALMDAIHKPFAAVEIVWTAGQRWTVQGLEWRDPRHFAVDPEDGVTLRLRTETQPTAGEDLAPWKWIVHAPGVGPLASRGLARTLAALYSIKTLGVGAWLAFVEIYGVPIRLGKYRAGSPEEDVDALEEALLAIGTDGVGIMPDTMSIEIPDGIGKAAGGAPHEKLAAWVDAQESKAIVGQTMTADGGQSYAQAAVHNLVRRDILVADARALAATLQRDLIEPYVQINYGPREPGLYPRITCDTAEPEDLAAFTAAFLPWVQAGVAVEASVIRDKFGVPAPAEQKPGDGPVEVVGGGQAQPPAQLRRRQGLAEEEADDFVDRDLAPDDWRESMRPMRDEIAGAAKRARNFGDFLARVGAMSVDGDRLVKSIATATMKARGVGDATDEVDL